MSPRGRACSLSPSSCTSLAVFCRLHVLRSLCTSSCCAWLALYTIAARKSSAIAVVSCLVATPLAYPLLGLKLVVPLATIAARSCLRAVSAAPRIAARGEALWSCGPYRTHHAVDPRIVCFWAATLSSTKAQIGAAAGHSCIKCAHVSRHPHPAGHWCTTRSCRCRTWPKYCLPVVSRHQKSLVCAGHYAAHASLHTVRHLLLAWYPISLATVIAVSGICACASFPLCLSMAFLSAEVVAVCSVL